MGYIIGCIYTYFRAWWLAGVYGISLSQDSLVWDIIFHCRYTMFIQGLDKVHWHQMTDLCDGWWFAFENLSNTVLLFEKKKWFVLFHIANMRLKIDLLDNYNITTPSVLIFPGAIATNSPTTVDLAPNVLILVVWKSSCWLSFYEIKY